MSQGIAHDKPEQLGNAVNSRGLIPCPQLSSSQRGRVLKRFALGLFAFAAGVAGNLVVAYIQQDAWQNLFTPERLIATAVGEAIMLLVLAALESERGLAWNWPWDRFWNLRGLAANPQIRQWESVQFIAVDDTLDQLAAQTASTCRLRGADAVYMAVAQRLQILLVR